MPHKPKHQELLLLNEGSKHLDRLINDSSYRASLISPNGKELVFGTSESRIVELRKLKLEVDELVEDITEDLRKQFKRFDESIVYE